jgi:hypothetical protein
VSKTEKYADELRYQAEKYQNDDSSSTSSSNLRKVFILINSYFIESYF